ncbi:MAG: hypothetical protein VKO65_03000 [Cyanobacteriota bacterium]|nr:hypothetical protein [Cyanobacteriota bacterium]
MVWPSVRFRSLALPLLLVGTTALPALPRPASAAPSAPAQPRLGAVPADAADADPRRLMGVWSLADNANVLFNLRLEADGQATTAAASRGPRPEGAGPFTAADLLERGRWRLWGNGLRIDYSSGWSDTLLLGPAGMVQWSWAPGADRNGPPTNAGKAVRIEPDLAAVVGVYRIMPSSAAQPPWLVSLLSDGRAANTLDTDGRGNWSRRGDAVQIDWVSGRRTRLLWRGQAPLRAELLSVGANREGAPSQVAEAVRL